MFEQHSERRAIFISDFLNPNCFYFKFYDEQFNEQLKLFEDKLAEHAWIRRKHNINRFEPKLNDIIAVFNISWSKWVRAIVKNVSVHSAEQRTKQYVLWAIDNGQYIKSFDGNGLVPLPLELRNFQVGGLYQGSIHGYRPAILELNKECLEEEMVPTENWSPRAIEMCKELIDIAPIVYFDVKGTHRGYLFGDLSFQMPDNHRLVSLGECLYDLRQIVMGDFNEERIANQYIQSAVFTSNSNHIVKQTESSSENSSKGRADGVLRRHHTNQPKQMQSKRESPPNKNYMEVKNVRMTEPPMSVLESEIDGGITRIRMNKRL